MDCLYFSFCVTTTILVILIIICFFMYNSSFNKYEGYDEENNNNTDPNSTFFDSLLNSNSALQKSTEELQSAVTSMYDDKTKTIKANKLQIGQLNNKTVDLSGSLLNSENIVSGVAKHNEKINPPYKHTDDWHIIVSPHTMGREEIGSEEDNALLQIQCYAIQSKDKKNWTAVAKYKYRTAKTTVGNWYEDGKLHYLLIRKKYGQ